jgi:hypothetical protein
VIRRPLSGPNRGQRTTDNGQWTTDNGQRLAAVAIAEGEQQTKRLHDLQYSHTASG